MVPRIRASTVANSFLIGPLVRAFVSAFADAGIRVTVTSGVRTRAQQEKLASSPNPYPVAAPGRSQHEFGVAVDMVANPREFQAVLGEVWKMLGLNWSASDEVHFAVFDNATWVRFLAGQPQVMAEQLPQYKTQYINTENPVMIDPRVDLPPEQPPSTQPPEISVDPPSVFYQPPAPPVSSTKLPGTDVQYMHPSRVDSIQKQGYSVGYK
jgi:hypothetical protein